MGANLSWTFVTGFVLLYYADVALLPSPRRSSPSASVEPRQPIRSLPALPRAALMRSAQASGIWLPAAGEPKLQPGDIYFICRAGECGGGAHAHIVREVGATSVTGMEGNVNNMIRVQPRTLPVNDLVGVARLR